MLRQSFGSSQYPSLGDKKQITVSGVLKTCTICRWSRRDCMPLLLHNVQVFHWLVEDRVDYIEVTPSVSRWAHVRIVSFLLVLLVRH